MSLIDDLGAARNVEVARACTACQWIDSLSEADAAAVQRWMDEKLSTHRLWKVCSKNGAPFSETTLRRHVTHYWEDKSGDI